MHVDEILFVGFNRRIAALDLRNGELVWEWKAPQQGLLVFVVSLPRANE